MGTTVRCVVTAKGVDGKSFIAKDQQIAMGPLGIFDFWATDQMPASIEGHNILDGKPTRLEPSTNGTLFRFLKFPQYKPIYLLKRPIKKQQTLLLRQERHTVE